MAERTDTQNSNQEPEMKPKEYSEMKRQIASLVIYVVSIVLLAIGLGTKGWREEDSTMFGLFSKPVSHTSDGTSAGNGTTCKSCKCCADHNEATKVLVTIGLATSICCPVFIAVYIFLRHNIKVKGIYQRFPLTNLIATIVGGVLTVIGCIVYAAQFLKDADVHYSFILSIIGSVCLISGGITGFCST